MHQSRPTGQSRAAAGHQGSAAHGAATAAAAALPLHRPRAPIAAAAAAPAPWIPTRPVARCAAASGLHPLGRRGPTRAAGSRRHRPVRYVVVAPLRATQQQQGDSSGGEPLSAVIADVLRQHRAQREAGGEPDLLQLLDNAGAGVAPVVTRTWDTNAVRLTLEGTWAGGGVDARRMAMLAVYQEHMVYRASVVRRIVDWVEARAPGALPQEEIDAVVLAEASNPINPAVEVLAAPQLTQLAAALVPLSELVAMVESAVDAARTALLARPPYSYSQAKREALEYDLAFLKAALLRGTAFARLRALLAAGGGLPEWEARAARQAQQAAAGGAPALQAEHVYYQQAWQPLQRERAADEARRAGAASPFETAAAAAAVAARPPDNDGPGDRGDTLWTVCSRIEHYTAQVRVLRPASAGPAGGPVQLSPGASPEVARAHRAAALDALCRWAASPEAGGAVAAGAMPLPLPPDCEARIAARSPEHDGLVRRVRITVPGGPELAWMRDLITKKGGGEFMSAFSPTAGNPFARTPEWDYFREAPAVWCRLVVEPPAMAARLAIKPLPAGDAASAAAAAAVGPSVSARAGGGGSARSTVDIENEEEFDLGTTGLGQLLQQLAAAVSGVPLAAPSGTRSGSSSSGSDGEESAAEAAAVAAPAGASVRVERPKGGRGGLRIVLPPAAGDTGAQPQELLLSSQQAGSLVGALDDLVTQLPGSFPMRQRPVVVRPPGLLTRTATRTARRLASAARALLAAGLLALPLIAIARPGRAVSSATTAAAASGAAATVLVAPQQQRSSSEEAAATAAAAAAAQPCNRRLSKKEAARVCDAVAAKIGDRVWLQLPEDDAEEWAELAAARAAAAANAEASSQTDQQQQKQQQQDSSSGQASAAAAADADWKPSLRAVFQVVIDPETTAVLGVLPCNAAAADAYARLPLVGELRGSGFATAQAKYLESLQPEKLQGRKSPHPHPQCRLSLPPTAPCRPVVPLCCGWSWWARGRGCRC